MNTPRYEDDTQYTPCPLTEECIFESNSPKGIWLKNNKKWLIKIAPIVTKSANISCRLYLQRGGHLDIPIFI